MTAEEGLVMDTMAGGGRYVLGSALEGAPVKLEGGRTVGHVKDGLVVITDADAIKTLKAGEPLGVSVGPMDRETWSVETAALYAPPEEATWPRSPDCRDGNCSKCDGTAWDLEADALTFCLHDCHPAAVLR